MVFRTEKEIRKMLDNIINGIDENGVAFQWGSMDCRMGMIMGLQYALEELD